MRKTLMVAAVVLVVGAAAVAAMVYPRSPDLSGLESATAVGAVPRIHPDYAGVVIPANIAPMNFVVKEPGDTYVVRLRAEGAGNVQVVSATAGIVIPADEWRAMLAQAAGKTMTMEVSVRDAETGAWQRFAPIENTVSADKVDPYLVYRRIKPMYNFYGPMGIYERCVETFEERPLVENSNVDGGRGCPNCHTFRQNDPGNMILHVRGPSGGMVLLHEGEIAKVDTRTKVNPAPGAFASWHPSGRVLAFSVNKVRQFFHPVRAEVRDAYDLDSDMAVYLLDSRSIVSTGPIRRPDRLETFPAWSADGKHLYFCSAPKLWTEDKHPPDRYAEVRYDLVRIAYDIDTGTWGPVETVVSAEKAGGSVTQPKISPDGRFALVCVSSYSCQPSFQPDADLYLVELASGKLERLACNSDLSESWHSWSSNGRWIAFSSKRMDGQFGRVFLAHVNADGKASKALALPQEDPRFYDRAIWVYQLPELLTNPVPASEAQMLTTICETESFQSDAITGASAVGTASTR